MKARDVINWAAGWARTHPFAAEILTAFMVGVVFGALVF